MGKNIIEFINVFTVYDYCEISSVFLRFQTYSTGIASGYSKQSVIKDSFGCPFVFYNPKPNI